MMANACHEKRKPPASIDRRPERGEVSQVGMAGILVPGEARRVPRDRASPAATGRGRSAWDNSQARNRRLRANRERAMPVVTADSARGDITARLPWGWRIASWIATAIGIVLLGYVIALWGWRWLGPPPTVVAPPAPPERWTPAIVAAPLFGRTGAPQAVDSSAPPTLQGDTRLLGVFAESGGAGYALFRLADRGPVLVKAGAEF